MVHKVLQEGHPVVRSESLYALDQIPMYYSSERQSKRHKVKRGGLKRAHELLAMMAVKVLPFLRNRSHPHHKSRRVWASYPRIRTISPGQASVPPTQA